MSEANIVLLEKLCTHHDSSSPSSKYLKRFTRQKRVPSNCLSDIRFGFLKTLSSHIFVDPDVIKQGDMPTQGAKVRHGSGVVQAAGNISTMKVLLCEKLENSTRADGNVVQEYDFIPAGQVRVEWRQGFVSDFGKKLDPMLLLVSPNSIHHELVQDTQAFQLIVQLKNQVPRVIRAAAFIYADKTGLQGPTF